MYIIAGHVLHGLQCVECLKLKSYVDETIEAYMLILG